MLKKTVSAIMLFLLVIGMLAFAFRIQPAISSPSTIIVPDDYPTIQAAVDAASAGDIIYVRAGTYNENVGINKMLSLVGESSSNTVIEGCTYDGVRLYPCIHIMASDVKVTGFTLENGGGNSGAGIFLDSASYCNIFGNNIINNDFGVCLDFSCSHNTVSANIIMYNGNDGVDLRGSSVSNTISGNDIKNNTDGILVDSCFNNIISENNIEAINYGWGIWLIYSSSGNRIFHNDFSYYRETGQPGMYPPPGANSWDDGYPSGGNYWSDYATRYPSAAEIDNSGLWNTPYVIDANNIDNYPLIISWGSSPVMRSSTSVACSPNPVSTGMPATCTAAVSGSNPTGTVTWSTSSSTGKFSSSSCNLISGSCSTNYIDTSAGTITITASYGGDSDNSASSNSTTLEVSALAHAPAYSITKLPLIPSGTSGEGSWTAAAPYLVDWTGHVMIDGALWNMLPTSEGSVSISYGNTLEDQIAFSQVNLNDPSQLVAAYPENIYGYSPNIGASSNSIAGYSSNQFAALQFPIVVSDFPRLWSVVDYSVAELGSNSLPKMDFAYDIWLSSSYKPYFPPNNGGVPPRGVVEIMIWTYSNDLNPAGYENGANQYPIPTWIDNGGGSGTLEGTLNWNVYVSNGDESQNKQAIVSFEMPSGEQSGIIGVDIKAVLNAAVSVLNSNYGWSSATLNSYWVNDIELGSEFGPQNNGESAYYQYTISSYHYVIDYSTSSSDLLIPEELGSAFFSSPTIAGMESMASTWIDHGSTYVYQPDTGVSTTISDSSAPDGTSVAITTAALSGAPTGVVQVGTTSAAYYDVNIQGISDGTASVCITNSGVLSQTTMQYWNGVQWVMATNVVVSGDTICGDIPVSALTGTPIAIGPIQPHDVGVIDVSPSGSWTYQGMPINISVTTTNFGAMTENETLNLFYTGTARTGMIGSETVVLAANVTETLTFAWNTTGVPFCYSGYNVTGQADISPEIDSNLTNNALQSSLNIQIRIPGDIDGSGLVDIYDAIILSAAFNSKPGSPNWNPNADINGDGIVDIYDAIIMSAYFNQQIP